MNTPLSVSLVSCIWQYVIATTTTDSSLHNEECTLGYYRYNNDTQRREQITHYIDCRSPNHCCGSFEYRICCEPPSTGNDSPTNAIVFGGIAGAIMFLCFCVCAVARWRQPSRPAEHPQAEALRAITGGFIPRTPFQGLNLSSLAVNTTETPSSNTPTVNTSTSYSKTPDTNSSSPPPLYEDCIRDNLIIPPSAPKENYSFTNTNIDHTVTPDATQGQHVNSSGNTTRF